MANKDTKGYSTLLDTRVMQIKPTMRYYFKKSDNNTSMAKIKKSYRASLVAQWLRICLPMQGTRVWALVREDPTCHRAAGPMRHDYWACALESTSHNYWACKPQLLKPVCLEPELHKRSHRNEKPTHRSEEWPPLAATRESPRAATKTQCSQK